MDDKILKKHVKFLLEKLEKPFIISNEDAKELMKCREYFGKDGKLKTAVVPQWFESEKDKVQFCSECGHPLE